MSSTPRTAGDQRDLIGQVDELTLLVEDVVELARRGERAPISEDVALEAIVAEAISRARLHSSGVHFSADLEPCTVRGDAGRLGRAVTNLLDNAAKWSAAGGTDRGGAARRQS